MTALTLKLPGISTQSGLARMGGNHALYWRLLKSFVDARRDSESRFRTLLEAGDFNQLYLDAHNLKGEAGNLGLDSVSSAADILGRHLKSHQREHIPELTDKLIAQCTSVLSALNQCFIASKQIETNAPSDAVHTLDIERVLPLITQLSASLQSKSFGARRLSTELAEITSGTELRAEFDEITQAALQLHYDDALLAIEQLLQRHEWKPP
jgi:HPt (histidine-containing phosphotransfer) domain-containing protein